ncbi:hypothetical protein [Auraticoccus monumenti]|uniref:Uncharacterized protein n=1 Tax=Auraticoccus monumenti TaxID=675864 RepID=A0A1G6WNX2_9ACTN|nr:hypothetical protein [Auraticoccus monumenti]SDD67568.1 hypothetical protein SAMN04489747_1495 [Auraticoccus monumenti]
MALYEIALQVVPVLMIALFLDARTAAHPPLRARVQNRLYVGLCVGAFAVSLLVVAGVLRSGQATDAVVIAALTGCIILMAAQAWRHSSDVGRGRVTPGRDARLPGEQDQT